MSSFLFVFQTQEATGAPDAAIPKTHVSLRFQTAYSLFESRTDLSEDDQNSPESVGHHAAAGDHRHHPEQNPLPQSETQRRGSPPRGPVEDAGKTATHQAGQAAGLQHPRLHHGNMRRLQLGWQRVLLRQTPWRLHLYSELLPHREVAHDGGDVRPLLQPRAGLLGHRRDLPGVLLPGQVPPKEGADERGAQKRGREHAGAGGRGVYHHVLLREEEETVGPLGKAQLVICCEGKIFLFFQRNLKQQVLC